MTAPSPMPSSTGDDVVRVARAIAEHGFGRPWDDFAEVDAHDTDQNDLLDYARAAVIAMQSTDAAPGAFIVLPAIEAALHRYGKTAFRDFDTDLAYPLRQIGKVADDCIADVQAQRDAALPPPAGDAPDLLRLFDQAVTIATQIEHEDSCADCAELRGDLALTTEQFKAALAAPRAAGTNTRASTDREKEWY